MKIKVTRIYCLICFVLLCFIEPVKINAQDNKNRSALNFSFELSSTTPFLNPPYISGTINDPSDPASTNGINLSVKEGKNDLSANDYTITASSSDTNIVHNSNILISRSDGKAIVKIIPSAPGYTDITLTLKKEKKVNSLLINYACSESVIATNTFWHTGTGDASTAIALDNNYMIVGDDEINQLSVYDRKHSGLPVAIFNYEKLAGLTEGNPGEYKEIDCEAGTRSLRFPERYYWTGSMSNGGKRFEEKPNRSCLFATNIKGSGALTKFSFIGSYNNLRRQLIKWGNSKGYKLSAAASNGETPKKIDGFNIEGIAFAPDSNTLYIGFRAPLVPPGDRTKALIAPIENFEQWFNNGDPANDPVIGIPIELDLNGRGIREIIHLSNGTYVIIAGSTDEKKNGALYTWAGKRTDKPVLTTILSQLPINAEGGMEVNDDNGKFTGKIQLISDNGTTVYYNDGVPDKQLPVNFKKFCSYIIDLF